MGRKRKVNDTFEGFGINPGDELKVWSGKSVLFVTANTEGNLIDFEGDLMVSVSWREPSWICPRNVDYIQIVEAAEPPPVPVRRMFGDNLTVTVTGSDLMVNGTAVSETLFLAVGFAADLIVAYDEGLACPSSEDLERAWTGAGCKLSPAGFSAGCASCTRAQLQESVHWAHDQLYGE